MELIPVHSRIIKGRFDLLQEIEIMLEQAGVTPVSGDVLAMSGKFIAMSEGRVVDLGEVVPMKDARRLAEEYSISPSLAEVILRESDRLLGGLEGFLLTLKDGAFAPNAGVDRSNVPRGQAVLHPSEPSEHARKVRLWCYYRYAAKTGVVITDSRLQPLRKGTVGIAIGTSGVPSTLDDRGKVDLFGNLMKVTRRAVVDDIASAVQLEMGETSEATPLVIVRGHGLPLDENVEGLDLSIRFDECIYVRGLSGMLSSCP